MKRLTTLVLLLCLILNSTFAAHAQTSATSPEFRPLIERVEAQTAVELAKSNVGSVSIGLVANGNLVWSKSYGMADMEKKTPATKDTIYRIGSITKQFTALMLLRLVQEGKVQFSDPVEKYFPEVNKVQGRFPNAPPITLIQLATHTSGLGREPANTETYLKGSVAEWEKVLLAALPQTKYAHEPGTRFSYSNIGYAILGATLGRAAGQPYVSYVQQHIFKPLGMTNTFFEANDVMRPKLAKGYLNEDGKIDATVAEGEHQGRGYKVPNGAVYTTVEDMARFLAFEMGAGPFSVLKKENLDESFKRFVIATSPDLKGGYGIGVSLNRQGEAVIYGHNGGVAGYQADAFFNPVTRTGIIILRNTIGDDFDSSKIVNKAFEK